MLASWEGVFLLVCDQFLCYRCVSCSIAKSYMDSTRMDVVVLCIYVIFLFVSVKTDRHGRSFWVYFTVD